MLRAVSILLMISIVIPCYAMQEPGAKRRKVAQKIPTLQEMAQKVVVGSALDLLQSPDAPEIFKKEPLKVLDMARQYFHPCVEPIIIDRLLEKYKAVVTAGCIKFKKEIKGVVDTIARVLRFNRQGNLLASGGLHTESEGYVTMWDIEKDELLLSVKCEDEVTALAFNAQSDQIAIGHKWGSIAILSIEDKRIRHITEHQDDVNALDYSPDGTKLASASFDGTVCIFDIVNGQCIRRLFHSNFLNAARPMSYVQLCDDGMVYAAGSGWGYVWDAQGVQQQRYPSQTGCMVQNASRDYFMWKDPELEVRGLDNKLLVSRLLCYIPLVKACSKIFSPDGNLLAVGLSQGSIYLFDCPSYQQAIEPLNILQALYLAYKLKESAEGQLWNGWMYYSTGESDACKEVGASLPDVFKKIIA